MVLISRTTDQGIRGPNVAVAGGRSQKRAVPEEAGAVAQGGKSYDKKDG